MRIQLWLLGAAMLGACSHPGEGDAGADAAVDPDVDAAVVPDVDAGPGMPDGGDGSLLFSETFDADGAWPAGWSALGGVASATVVGGRGHLVPTVTSYSLARMGHALPPGTVDVDVRFTMTMTDGARQGVGVYVRQSGGYLQATTPRGRGYCVFVEAFRGAIIGAWREVDGGESPVRMESVTALVDGTSYAVHFRVTQGAGVTTIAARVWPAGTPEPQAWTIDTTDATPSLQGIDGGVAIDAWNTATPGNGPVPAPIFVDDLEIRAW